MIGLAVAQEPPQTVVESLVVLGENYEAGDWVRQSDLLAYMWYLLAANAGHDRADAATADAAPVAGRNRRRPGPRQTVPRDGLPSVWRAYAGRGSAA